MNKNNENINNDKEPEKIKISHESNDLRWFSWTEAFGATQEPSMVRQFHKALYLKEKIQNSPHLSLDKVISDLTFDSAEGG